MTESLMRVDQGVLYVGDQCIELPHPVVQVVKCQGIFIVRVEPPAGVVFNRNVIAFANQGQQLWQIEESPHGTEADKPYVGITVEADGSLTAANWNGVDYRVDLRDGSIAVKAFNK